MAYKREEQRIIPGSVNLLPPPDAVADGDCLQLQNFQVDRAGNLVQARGLTLAPGGATDANLTYRLDSLCLVNTRRYFGGAGGLWVANRRGAPDPPGAIETGFDGQPLGLLSFQGWLWCMNRSKQRRDNGTAIYGWTPQTGAITSVAATPGAGSLAAGEHDYYITYCTADGWEGQPSAASTITATASDLNTITRTAATDASITGWNIYVKRPNLAAPYKLNNTAVAIGTATYQDNGTVASLQSDDDLLNRNEVLDADRGAAPAASVLANLPHNGRILAANSAANPNRIWYTNANEPWYFPSRNYVDVGELNDPIVFISVKPGGVLIYKQRSIWRCIGDIDAGQIDPVAADVGGVGMRAVAPTSQGDYFVANECIGLAGFDGWRKISPKIDPLFRGEAVYAYAGDWYLPILYTSRAKCALGFRNGRLWFSYPTQTTSNGATLIYHPETGRWASRISSASQPAWQAYFDEGDAGDFLGASQGQVHELEKAVYTDDSYPHALVFQSRYEDQGQPDKLKTYADLSLEHNTRGETLTLYAVLNNGTTTATDLIPIATFTSTVRTRTNLRLVYPATWGVVAQRGLPIADAYNLAVRITGSADAATPVTIYGPMLLHYYVHPRRAKTFDSDETDHGVPEVKTIDQVELDLDNPSAAATLQIYSSIPGGVMAARLGAGTAIAVTTGRQMVVVPLAAPIDGRLLRYSLISTATGDNQGFLLYGLRVRVYRTGEYLDGSNTGEKWACLPISIGV